MLSPPKNIPVINVPIGTVDGAGSGCGPPPPVKSARRIEVSNNTVTVTGTLLLMNVATAQDVVRV